MIYSQIFMLQLAASGSESWRTFEGEHAHWQYNVWHTTSGGCEVHCLYCY